MLLGQVAGLRLLLSLRPAAIAMALVNGACALGPTPLRPYLLASLVLVLARGLRRALPPCQRGP